ncbi:DNA-directed RNA polymerase [Abeliophyllum distichum]|uniref:DNA-directed RNA polymerase n=1 Tax=Abeliophyllum distichum TaxID=126358 RepID=A0ABD1SZZ5_9LAMI
MAVEFEPSKEVSGGVWCIRVQKVATLERVYEDLKKQRVVNFDISSQQVSEILNSMVLDNEIIEVKSTGLGEYYSIPIGTVCYRFDSGPGVARVRKLVHLLRFHVVPVPD